MKQILEELEKAKKQYPQWPDDIVHRVSIMNEEAGESRRAALNHYYHGDSIDKVRAELIQTAAMCIRCIESIDQDNKQIDLDIF